MSCGSERSSNISKDEKKTFATQEGANRGREKPGRDQKRPADHPKPRPDPDQDSL
jgi:hypothetical protein